MLEILAIVVPSFTAIAVAFIMTNKIERVHKIVNSNHSLEQARLDQLEQVIQTSNKEIPPRPVEPVGDEAA